MSELSALVQVLLLDIVLAGDNAIVVGMVAASMAGERRRRVIGFGILFAVVCRIALSLITVQLLQVIGLLFAGGLLLLWVAWKLWRETRAAAREASTGPGAFEARAQEKTMRQAVTQIVIADLSMSLDNVLAVAGAARDHVWVLVVGLAMSVALMGVAATIIARYLDRYRWLSYVGIVVIVFVAGSMIHEGAVELLDAMPAV